MCQRTELFNFIRDNRIGGVVLLSGDQHLVSVSRFDDVAPCFLCEFSPTLLGTQPAAVSAINDPELLFMYQATLAYGLFEIDLSP